MNNFILFILGLLMFPIGIAIVGAGLLGYYDPSSLDPDYRNEAGLRRVERRWELEELEEREESEHVAEGKRESSSDQDR